MARGFPLFVSHRQLAAAPGQLRPASCRWALDSGGFTELSLHGRWVTPAEDYAAAVARYAERIGGLDFAAPQDWMCEPFMIARTGLSVTEHLHRTVANYLTCAALRRTCRSSRWCRAGGWPTTWPALDLYRSAGVDLAALPRVGLGSVCRRQSTAEIAVIVTTLARRGLRLHGFGVKTGGLHLYGHLLASADSMAWSYAARRAPAARLHRAQELRQLPDLRHPVAGSHARRYAARGHQASLFDTKENAA